MEVVRSHEGKVALQGLLRVHLRWCHEWRKASAPPGLAEQELSIFVVLVTVGIRAFCHICNGGKPKPKEKCRGGFGSVSAACALHTWPWLMRTCAHVPASAATFAQRLDGTREPAELYTTRRYALGAERPRWHRQQYRELNHRRSGTAVVLM